MKPRAFIGSSTPAANYAGAVHDALADIAECTTWTEGAFGLSKSTINNLLKNLRDSDFGIFVFAADDTATIKGELLNVPRDNVVYEGGMFAGYLLPERCFIAVPKSVPVRVPTDLLGMTLGFYEDDRSDKNYVSAVSTFCRQVRAQIERQGLFTGQPRELLRELCVKFQCCDWIQGVKGPDEWKPRVARKRQVAADIDAFCKVNPVNKARLLHQHQTGYYIAMLSAIKQNPEPGDEKLILQVQPANLPSGFAYERLMDAAEALKASGFCDAARLSALSGWLKRLPSIENIKSRIEAI